MFINTIQDNQNFETGRKQYDSRIPKKIKEEQKVETIFIDKSKIENVIVLYKHNIKVICSFILDDTTIEGIPTSFEDNDSTIDVIVNGVHQKVLISKIKDFKILEI